MKDFEFYQNLDLMYPELAICIENSLNGIAKFFIPILTPILDGSYAYDNIDINVNKSNILNDSSSMDITACTSSNYLELKLPDNDNSCKEGDIFVVSFIGGNPNMPFIMGRYYNAINQ